MHPDSPTEAASPTLPEFNPYQAPSANLLIERHIPSPQDYPGIGRLACFGAIFLIGLASNIVTAATNGSFLAGALVMAVALWPVHSRLKNIGRNPNWCFLVLPAGYQDHRKFDTPAKIIGLLCLVFLVFLAYITFA